MTITTVVWEFLSFVAPSVACGLLLPKHTFCKTKKCTTTILFQQECLRDGLRIETNIFTACLVLYNLKSFFGATKGSSQTAYKSCQYTNCLSDWYIEHQRERRILLTRVLLHDGATALGNNFFPAT